MSQDTAIGATAAEEQPTYRRVYRRTITWRVVHWANVASIIVAAVTGAYIANPFYASNVSFVMAWNRAAHLYAAMVLDVSIILIAYLYFFSRAEREWRHLRPTRKNLLDLQEAFLNVAMLGRRKRFDSSKLDPLNVVWFTLLHLMVLFQLLTGLQLYVYGMESGISSVGAWWPDAMHWTTDWTLWVFGGIGGVRVIHHFMLYPIVAWALLHIYYEIWRTVTWKEADINIMFGGHKFARSEPAARAVASEQGTSDGAPPPRRGAP
jgi:Ni/Fe-hydrogenase 1 B-type cytochrome subunit